MSKLNKDITVKEFLKEVSKYIKDMNSTQKFMITGSLPFSLGRYTFRLSEYHTNDMHISVYGKGIHDSGSVILNNLKIRRKKTVAEYQKYSWETSYVMMIVGIEQRYEKEDMSLRKLISDEVAYEESLREQRSDRIRREKQKIEDSGKELKALMHDLNITPSQVLKIKSLLSACTSDKLKELGIK